VRASSQGQSKENTPRKEDNFAAALEIMIDVSKAVARFPFWYVSLNCGELWNEEVDCPGDVLRFMDLADRQRRRYRVIACDHNDERMSRARGRMERRGFPAGCSVEFYSMDNRYCLPLVLQRIRGTGEDPRKAVGACLADPNSPPVGLPLRELDAFARICERIDHLVCLNVAFLNMRAGAIQKGQRHFHLVEGYETWDQPLTAERIIRPGALGKRDWMVASRPHVAPMGFLVAYGTNFDRGCRHFTDYYPLASPEGQLIVRGKYVPRGVRSFLFDEE